MSTVFGAIVIFILLKLLFGGRDKREQSSSERETQTIFKYPKGGYGLDDDPVLDELFFIDTMEDD